MVSGYIYGGKRCFVIRTEEVGLLRMGWLIIDLLRLSGGTRVLKQPKVASIKPKRWSD